MSFKKTQMWSSENFQALCRKQNDHTFMLLSPQRGHPTFVNPRNQGCPSDYLDNLKKKSGSFSSDFCQKSFLWLTGSTLHGISERYFCFKELTTSGASMSHWKISNCFLSFFLTITIIWQFLLLESRSS